MAYYTGYVTLPVTSYDDWKTVTNGNGFNFDNTYGCQCYDLAVEFWWNVGFPQGYPIITNSSAYTMWNNRMQNIAYNGTTYFDLVYNLADVRKGDVMVFAGTSSNPYGHVGFADRDYAGWNPSDYEFPILSENNGGTPDPQGGAYTNVHGYDTRLFLGAFRLKSWHTVVPVTPTLARSKFPFVLYANRLRSKY